jgi:hypothetical protein
MKPAVIRNAIWIVIALAPAIQLIRPDRSNPPVTREIRWDSEATAELARRTCYDCHSYETEWPWYSSVAPVTALAEGLRATLAADPPVPEGEEEEHDHE